MGQRYVKPNSRATIGARVLPSMPSRIEIDLVPANDNKVRVKPANDNIPGRGKPRTTFVQPGIIRGISRAIRGIAIQGAVVPVPRFDIWNQPEPQQAPLPAYYLRPGGRFNWCAYPGGFGGAMISTLTYLPPNTPQGNACIGLQALPGGNDGLPDKPPAGATTFAYWRYSNTDLTRYEHLWSIQNGMLAYVRPYPLPAPIREAGYAPSPRLAYQRKPKENVKEKKFAAAAMEAAQFALTIATEGWEAVEKMYANLPDWARTAKNGHDKLLLVLEHFDHIDWEGAIRDIYGDQSTDRLLAKLLSKAKRFPGHHIPPPEMAF